MPFASIFITKTRNGVSYPSFFSRSIGAIIVAFTGMDFDYLATNQSIAENNYWFSKIIISFFLILLVEYIFRIHLWCFKQYGRWKSMFLVGLNQFLLGVFFPRIFIWQILTKLLGVTYLSHTESLFVNREGSVAMINEFLVMVNVTFVLSFGYTIYRRVRIAMDATEKIIVSLYGIISTVDIDEVRCILRHNDRNVVFTMTGGFSEALNDCPLMELLAILPPDVFEIRGSGIFRKGTDERTENIFLNYSVEILRMNIK